MMKFARLTMAIAAFALAPGCSSDRASSIDAITLVASAEMTAPAPAVDAAVEIKGTDPATLRLYLVPAALAPIALADIERNADALGRWAAGSRAAWDYGAVGDWKRGELRAALPVERGDLILLAIEPVSAAGGARFAWRDAIILSGAEQ
ncbi:hypothetical protein SPYCA_2677 [Sphingopyxis sp. FD7]|nr:hypothetical protein SPYCA_2677 [Sphingopyxis sp. FD7]